MERTPLRAIVTLLALALALGGLAPATALGGIVATHEVIEDRQAGGTDRDRIRDVLQRDDVREALTDYGVAPGQAEERVAALSDQEARELARRIEEQPAGASGVTIGLTTILLVVIIWILVD